MGRAGLPRDRSQGPERRCIATGETYPAARLLRFVVAPGGELVADITGKLPGRGIWVLARRDALERALARNLFARVARQPVRLPQAGADAQGAPAVGQQAGQQTRQQAGQQAGQVAAVIAALEARLAERVISLISLARKGGQAVAGYERVRDWLARGRARVLIQASDGSQRGRSKLSPPPGGAVIGILTAAELGSAFGRQSTVHAALGDGGLVERVVEEAARLEGLRLLDGDSGCRKGKKTR